MFWTDGEGLHAVPKAGGQAVLLEERAAGSFTYEANAVLGDDTGVFVADRSVVRFFLR